MLEEGDGSGAVDDKLHLVDDARLILLRQPESGLVQVCRHRIAISSDWDEIVCQQASQTSPPWCTAPELPCVWEVLAGLLRGVAR